MAGQDDGLRQRVEAIAAFLDQCADIHKGSDVGMVYHPIAQRLRRALDGQPAHSPTCSDKHTDGALTLWCELPPHGDQQQHRNHGRTW